jgi:ATP-dependent exoDNAse (exonuclease V) alpha subunit
MQRSVVASASYRSGTRLHDRQLDKWFFFDKPDVVHSEILAEPGAPDWVFDRQELWNRVERSEKRIDAQLAREAEVTCPRELNTEQCIELIRSFVQDQFVSKGMVADINIHRPAAADGEDQPHAHILLTMRKLDPSTETGFSRLKAREWNEDPAVAEALVDARKRHNNSRSEEDKAALEVVEAQRNVNVWRREWANYANRKLESCGFGARIDHRTLEKQGIFRLPQINFGASRHVTKAYVYLKDKLTQWVSTQHRSKFYQTIGQYNRNDPVKLASYLLRLTDMAEDIATSYRRNHPIPEVNLER